MKTSPLYLISVLMWLVFSCRSDDISSTEITRVIVNSSGHDLELKVFDEGVLKESITIPDDETDSASAKCRYADGPYLEFSRCSVSWALEGMDSVKVVFDDSKEITYLNCEELPCHFDCSNVPSECFVNEKNIMFITSELGYYAPQLRINAFDITVEEYNLAQ